MVDRLREALDRLPEGTDGGVFVQAARRFLALTETGQRVEWCTNHDHEGDELSCWLVAWTSVSTPCDMRPALVIPADYLTEEDRSGS